MWEHNFDPHVALNSKNQNEFIPACQRFDDIYDMIYFELGTKHFEFAISCCDKLRLK